MNPLGTGSEDGKSLAGPETVRLTPVSDIRNVFLHVLVKSIQVAFPLKGALISLDILKDNASPLGMMHYLVYLLDSIRCAVFLDANIADALNVLSELLV